MSLFEQHLNRRDHIVGTLFTGVASLVVVLLVLIVLFLVKESYPVLSVNQLVRFITTDGWYPSEDLYGLLPMVVASLLVAILSVVFALPLAFASALFLCSYAPAHIAKPYRTLLNLLAGIPSVIYGLWGLTVLVPLLAKWQAPGASLLAASIILTLMILPTIALSIVASIETIPPNQNVSANALALSRLGKLKTIIYPYAKQGMFSGCLLGLTRALGETMAVLMVAGNIVQFPHEWFAPVRTLTANIALEMAYATDDHRASLFATGLFLTTVVYILVMATHRITRNNRHG